MHAQVMQVAFQ